MKKVTSSLLTAVILIGMLTGCAAKPADLTGDAGGSSKEAASNSASTESSQAAPMEYAKITWFYNEGGKQLTADSYPVKKIKEDLNIDLEHITLPTGMDYTERLMTLVAGGETPDIIDTDSGMTSKLLKEDLIIPVEDYLNDDYLPNLARISLNWENVLQEIKWSDGHTYTIPSVYNNPLQDTPWIRKDWLDNLGLSMPTTMEELATVLEAFAKGDPNGDGSVHYATMANEFWGFGPFLNAMGAGLMWYKGADGMPELGFLSERIKDATRYCKNLVDQGAINQDFVTMNYDNIVEKLKAGAVGYLYGWNGNAQGDSIKEVYPNAEWAPMTPVKGVYDKGYINIQEGGSCRNLYAISKACKDVDAVMRLMDYMCVDTSDADTITFEGGYWNMLGVRGVNWDLVNGVCETGNGESGDMALAKKFKDQNDNIDKWVSSVARRFCNQFDTRWMGVDPRNIETNRFLLSIPMGKDIPDSDPLKPYKSMVIEDEVVTTFADDWTYYKFAEQFFYDAILGKGDIDELYQKFLDNANKAGYQDIRKRMAEIVPK